MSSEINSNENLVLVCPNDDEETSLEAYFAISIAMLTLIGSLITYFIQRNQERQDALEAAEKEEKELDRSQALERVRTQLSVLIGPMHRAWKTQGTIISHYILTSGHGFGRVPRILKARGQAFWVTPFDEAFLEPFKENPYSKEAILYRNFVTRRLKPVYTRIRELILNHMADLADMPPQEEWLQRWAEADVTSPYNGSININVIFDSYTAMSYEYDDIIQSWQEEDFSRMQPSMRHPFLLSNDLIDLLYDNAKAKEAKYNKHVTVHKNERQEQTTRKMLEEGIIQPTWVAKLIIPKDNDDGDNDNDNDNNDQDKKAPSKETM